MTDCKHRGIRSHPLVPGCGQGAPDGATQQLGKPASKKAAMVCMQHSQGCWLCLTSVAASHLISLTLPVSMTQPTSSMVREVSATLVAITILRTPGGTLSRQRVCTSHGAQSGSSLHRCTHEVKPGQARMPCRQLACVILRQGRCPDRTGMCIKQAPGEVRHSVDTEGHFWLGVYRYKHHTSCKAAAFCDTGGHTDQNRCNLSRRPAHSSITCAPMQPNQH